MEERIIELEKEIRTKVDETRVIEMIKEAQLEKKPSKVISPNEVKEVVQIQVKEQNMESKDIEKTQQCNNFQLTRIYITTKNYETTT